MPHLRGLSLAIRVIIATRRYDSTGFLPFFLPCLLLDPGGRYDVIEYFSRDG